MWLSAYLSRWSVKNIDCLVKYGGSGSTTEQGKERPHFEALPPLIHRRLCDRSGIGQEPSIEDEHILSSHRSSDILQRLLVDNADGVDGAAGAVWRYCVFRFRETSSVAAQDNDVLGAGAGEGRGGFAADTAALLVVLVT